MDEIILSDPIVEELSPYDASYPIQLLSNGIKEKFEVAQNAADLVYKTIAREAPVMAQIQKATQKGSRYVVDASEAIIKDIDAGKIKLVTTKTGKMTAQVRQADGTFGTKLAIKKETFRQGLNPVEVGNALQMMALQDQLQEMTNQIISIDRSVHDVLQGQQNDRLGLYYSGLAMYLEARSTTDPELKRALIVQSLRSLSDASFQLSVTMQSDIKYLVDGKYNSERGKKRQLIDERMQNINESFGFIHQASMLRAAIYCEQNEMKAMTTVLKEYSHFIESTISSNAGLLAQCDMNDNGTDEGLWKSRVKLKLDVSEIERRLSTEEKVLYIGMEEEA